MKTRKTEKRVNALGWKDGTVAEFLGLTPQESALIEIKFDRAGDNKRERGMHRQAGRQKEAALIRQANRAAAVGRLLLGEVRDWTDFLEPEVADLDNLPRRQLKAGKADVRARLSGELTKFCDRNFVGMNVARLSQMYEDIKANRGMELPLAEFESRFARVRPEVLKGNPAHLTVSVSLWGFQLKVPEEQLAHDVMEAVALGDDAQTSLAAFEGLTHTASLKNRDEIRALFRKKLFAARATVIACFNLMEAYLNGLAWDYLRTTNPATLSAGAGSSLMTRRPPQFATSSASIRRLSREQLFGPNRTPTWQDFSMS